MTPPTAASKSKSAAVPAKDVKPAKKAPSGPDYGARLGRLRELTKTQNLNHILVTNPLDVGYLTGFLGGDSYLMVSPATAVIISDFRYQEELEPVKSLARIHIRTGPIVQAVAEVFTAERVDRCGIQTEYVTIAEQQAIAAALGKGPQNRLVNTKGLVSQMRIIKDEHEVGLIRKAVKIGQEALEAILPRIKVGLTELEVAAMLEAEMKTRGSAKPGFESIVAARANGSFPHYRPQDVKLAANAPLLIDWGATWQGYHGDMTRTFAFGKWPAKIKEIYTIVLDAQMKAADALAPGKSAKEIDAIARDLITAAGFGEEFGHSLGHGLGLNGHEEPRLSHMLPDTVLKAGQVVTVEPGIYLPGVGGVRIEDDYLITETGAKNLCTMPKDLEWATL